ncbi:hypothetical protein CSA56_09740 [candidate division KSB3 bacterium]|uniref:Response regulatory domain-containing protein n=1 Tax=candidate division KSB3 bacterium TaxID=2044937 RepID=A0A2G6KDL2_9BACT|nr:MAG: hypothetical protein CSA56_09740 [candidate division KSB3 bacterium]
MSKPNVLVIAEHTDVHHTMKTILADEYEYLAASNGIDGVAMSRMARPSVIFIDHNLNQPHAAGICKSLSFHKGARSIPILVLADTTDVNGDFRTLPNYKGVIPKPFQADQIRTHLQNVLTAPGAATGAPSKPKFTRNEPIRVLSVDDSSVVRKLVTMILTAEGFKVTTASDGLDGINKAKELKPDIILLDFVMPKMNGFQVCRILQKDEKLRQIPVILVTSKGDKVGDKFVNQLGVIGYITKPFQPEELVSKIHQTLESQEPELPVAVQESPPEPAVSAPAASQPAAGTAPPLSQPPQAPQAVQTSAPVDEDTIRKVVQNMLTKTLEAKVSEMVKLEINAVIQSLDKRIEKRVIEKMNEYIRRAKKK